MSLTEIAAPHAAVPSPVSVPDHGWRSALIALAVTGVIVVAGESFGATISEAVQRLTPDANPIFARLAAPVIVSTYQIALLWFVVGWLVGPIERRASLGLAWPALRWWHWFAAIGALYALKAVLSLAMVFAVQGADVTTVATPGASPFGALMRTPAWPLMLLGGVLAAVVEEMLYRGYLSRTLEASRLGFWAGASVAAIVWAGLHAYYPFGMQVVLAVMGVALSWLRARTGSIYPGMAWHILNNSIALIALKLIG
jgi:membrane protease YdiL (CAAX protease family)